MPKFNGEPNRKRLYTPNGIAVITAGRIQAVAYSKGMLQYSAFFQSLLKVLNDFFKIGYSTGIANKTAITKVGLQPKLSAIKNDPKAIFLKELVLLLPNAPK